MIQKFHPETLPFAQPIAGRQTTGSRPSGAQPHAQAALGARAGTAVRASLAETIASTTPGKR